MLPRKMTAGLGLYVFGAGIVSLAAWVLDVPRLADWLGTGISIQPNTTVAAIATGSSLLLLVFGRPRVAAVAAVIAALIGSATLFEHVSGIDLGIDRLLLFDRPWGRGRTVVPGRMGPPGSLAWTMLGAGLLLTTRGARGRSAAAAISILVMLLSALSLVGYLFGVQQFYALPQLTAISLQSATTVFGASAALMFAIPEHGLAASSGRDDAGGVLLRRMVLPVFLVPLVFGWLRLEGERAGLYDTAFGEATFVIFTTTALLALLALTARHIGRSASALSEAAHTQRVLARIGELAAKVRDTGNLLEAISETVAKALGASRCGFARVDLETGQLALERDYHGDRPSISGTIPLAKVEAHIVQEARAGRVTNVRDVRRLRGLSEEHKRRFERYEIRSLINVPLHRDGRLAVNFWVAHHEPRNWDPRDVELMKNVADRAWLVMEKARAVEEQQAALRALAERELVLREADRRKNEFMATLAHELRNPLAPVVNALELIKVAKGDLGLIEKCRQMMERQLGHTVRLVDDLMDVSRLTRDSIELRREDVDLEPIVESALEAVRPLAEETGHRVEVSLPPERIRLHVDPVRIAQVLTNLLTNACKYTPEGGRITLEAERQGSEVEIRVIDTGIGMPSEKIESAFEMFSQLERPVRSVSAGLGIGLSLVRSLVEKHGGTVSAHSEGTNLGTQFVVRLPVRGGASVDDGGQTVGAPEPDARSGTGRVLVVDDNLDAANTLAAMLAVSGYETEVAHDGTSALAMASWYEPTAILLDIGLPDIDGYEVCRAIREQPSGRNMRIVAVTGWGAAHDRTRSAEAGFDAHLVKPVSPSKVLETLVGLLASGPNHDGVARASA